jgi:hypothetical protein
VSQLRRFHGHWLYALCGKVFVHLRRV